MRLMSASFKARVSESSLRALESIRNILMLGLVMIGLLIIVA
jgi:hypothetical protein